MIFQRKLSIFTKKIMEKTINIQYPASLANSLRMSRDDFSVEIKTSALVKLYELGKISSGIAAKILEINRVDFLDLLAKYKVSIYDYSDIDSLQTEISNA